MSVFSPHSTLYDEKTFYQAFLSDLESCQNEVIIESPYITRQRMGMFDRNFKKLLERSVKIYIFTRNPQEHDQFMEPQSEETIRWCESIGIQVFLCLGNHHRKLAIIDRKILWEGSLNILSQTKSREIMRKIDDKEAALEMFNFLGFRRFI